MKRVIGIGNALTDMLVNLKTDTVLLPPSWRW